MDSISSYQIFSIVWAWIIPILLLVFSGKQSIATKAPWLMLVLLLSWLGLMIYLLITAITGQYREQSS